MENWHQICGEKSFDYATIWQIEIPTLLRDLRTRSRGCPFRCLDILTYLLYLFSLPTCQVVLKFAMFGSCQGGGGGENDKDGKVGFTTGPCVSL